MNDNRVTAAVAAMRAALSKNDLVLILGAGVTASATNSNKVSLWQGLIRNAIDRCVELDTRDKAWADRAKADVDSPYNDDLIAAAEKATSGLGGRTSSEYHRWLRNTVGSLHIEDCSLTDVIKLYAERESLIATTNYDDIPSDATGWDTVTWRDYTTIQRVYRGDEHAIIHLHGHWRVPESVVFGSSSYADVLSDQHSAEFLRMLLYAKTAVFCGFGAGLRDPNFTALRNWLTTYKDSGYPNYRLVRDAETEAAERDHRTEEHITVVPFGPKREDLPAFLRAIVSGGPSRDTRAAKARRSARLDRPASPKCEIATSPPSTAARSELAHIAGRLAEVEAIATDTAGPVAGSAADVIAPAVRDVYIRFRNVFDDEAAFIARRAADPGLTQPQADEALGVGRRLIAVLDSQTI
jgi:SIR2-like protein